MKLTSPRAQRAIGRVLRTPAAFDRPGLRFLLNGMSPAPIVVLVHHGRRTGKTYKTPLEAIAQQGDEIVVSPMFGERSHWYRNVLAGGLEEVHLNGEARRVDFRPLGEGERRQAIATYRSEHPVYSRVVLRGLVKLHGLGDDPIEEIVRTIPMLAFHPPR